MSIKEVYEKWKYCDKLFNDTKWLPINWQGEVILDLWRAIKEEIGKGG